MTKEQGELFTEAQCERYFREEVAAAGGAKKWLRKNKIHGKDHVLHMIEDGRLFCDFYISKKLGFRRVERWEVVASE
jgi:hypothetical protein